MDSQWLAIWIFADSPDHFISTRKVSNFKTILIRLLFDEYCALIIIFFDFGMEGFFSESFENITGLSECQLVFDFLGPMVYAQIANPKVVLPTG